jgi:hypothetical protein
MKKVHLSKKFDFTVPEQVISSLWNIASYVEKNPVNPTGKSIQMWECQTNSNKDLLLNKESMSEVSSGMPLENKIEFFKLRNKWAFDNEDTAIVDSFLKQHFTSYFQFRIDRMAANYELNWHAYHAYPRVFIPMHDNKCVFKIKNNNEQQTLKFDLGTCWMWDVREHHYVHNDSPEARTMALFCIDPAVEKIADIFV